MRRPMAGIMRRPARTYHVGQRISAPVLTELKHLASADIENDLPVVGNPEAGRAAAAHARSCAGVTQVVRKGGMEAEIKRRNTRRRTDRRALHTSLILGYPES